MKRRPSFRYALLLALVTAATTWAALLAWRGFLVDSDSYLAPLAVTAIVVAAGGAVLRWLTCPVLVTLAAQAALAVVMVSIELGGGPLPVGATGAELTRSLDLAVESARLYEAPIAADVPSVAPLLIIGGAFFVLLVDVLACTLRRVPLAGLALLAIYSVPAGLVENGPGLIAFLLAATGFLAMLHLDSHDHLLTWGSPLGPDDANPWTETNPVADAVRVGAGRIGVTATALAVLLPPFVPVLDLNIFGIGAGGGDENIEIRNPRTDLRRDLERDEDVPLIRFRTDDPSPGYLRVAVLNRFTGVEWSSGDRGVADENTATGVLPEPQGLAPEVPRVVHDYEFEADDAFDSSWLPTQFPAASVEAEGDWRFDEDTMDFLAVPDDLTTEDLEWSVSGIEPDYGVSGEYFRDAAINEVDDEFLEIPAGLPPVVRREADAVTAGARNDYESALLLQDWFRESGGFTYSLDRAPSGVGAEAFETFLDADEPGGRVGYCEQFASAMAVMSRMAGVPARVAVGFLAPDDLGNGTFEYSSHDLHAWPELYFDGAGWVRFEPTPPSYSGTVPDYSTVPVEGPAPTESVSTAPTSETSRTAVEPETQVQTSAAPQDQADGRSGGADEGAGWAGVLLWFGVAVLVLAGLALVAVTPRFLRKRIRERRLAGTPEEMWDELRATARDLRVPWPAGRSPQEVAAVLSGHLGDRGDAGRPERPRTGPDADPEACAALERVVAALELTRYARPGAPVVTDGLADDTRACCASLAAGAPRRDALRGDWLPRSLWRPPVRDTVEPDQLVNA